jgi:hypothetical protein
MTKLKKSKKKLKRKLFYRVMQVAPSDVIHTYVSLDGSV